MVWIVNRVPDMNINVYGKRIIITLVLVLTAIPGITSGAEKMPYEKWHMGELPHTLVLAMDGIPYGVVETMYRKGHFQNFYPPAKMVSTFPSMTDVAFTEIFGLHPTRGYQQVYYSRKENRVVGGLGSEMFELEEFERHFDSIVHSKSHLLMLYITCYRAANIEWDQLKKKFWASKKKPKFYGYIAATDAIGHRFGHKGLKKQLKTIDGEITKLRNEYKSKTGRELRIIMLSDHGNTLVKGKLINANIELKKRGFNIENTIRNEKSVVSTVAGVVGYWALYATQERAPSLADKLTDMEGVDLVMYRHIDEKSIVVAKEHEKAIISYDKNNNRGRYKAIKGDPLEYLELLSGGGDFIDQKEIFDRTLNSKYPNAIYRIYRCFNGSVKNPATLIVSLKPGYEFSNKLIKTAAVVGKRWGTHGSLHAADSLGIYMRTDRPAIDVPADKLGDHIEFDYFVSSQDNLQALAGTGR